MTRGARDVVRTVRNAWQPAIGLPLAGRAIQLANGFLLSVILVHRFGLQVVGSFALGIAAANVLVQLCPLGLPAQLPRLRQSHGRSAFTGLVVLGAQAPIVLVALVFYALWQGRTAYEARLLLTIGLSGYCIAFTNVGLMLAIMRRRLAVAVLGPLCETVGLATAALLAPTPLALAAALLLSRAASALLFWGSLPLERVPLRRIVATARGSGGYILNDVLSIVPEQAMPLILARFVGREELGLFRLCQQLMLPADSTGWTFVQSRYPDLVRDGHRLVETLAHRLTRLGAVATVGTAASATVLGLWVFRTPRVVPLVLLLSASIVWRYRSYLYGQAFRAAGRVTELTWISLARVTLNLGLFALACRSFDVWGAVLALIVVAVVWATVFRLLYRRAVAEHEPTAEPAATAEAAPPAFAWLSRRRPV